MSILRGTRRQLRKQAEDTTDDVSDAAASGNTPNPNEPWTRKGNAQAGDPDDDRNIILALTDDGYGEETAASIVASYRRRGLSVLTPSDQAAMRRALKRARSWSGKAARPAMRKGGAFPDGEEMSDLRGKLYRKEGKPKERQAWRKRYDELVAAAIQYAESLKGKVVTDTHGLISGEVLGGGSIKFGQFPLPAARITILTGHEKGKESLIPVEDIASVKAGNDQDADMMLAAKAAVIDPKIAVLGTPFEARARITNKTNGRLLKSKEFKGRFAKASARAWAEAEVKKLL